MSKGNKTGKTATAKKTRQPVNLSTVPLRTFTRTRPAPASAETIPAPVTVLPVNPKPETPTATRRTREAYRTAYYHRDPKNPLSIGDAQDILSDIERARDWYTIPNPAELSYDAGANMLTHRGETVGRLSARGWTALAYWARESSSTIFSPKNPETIPAALAARDWKTGLMARRIIANDTPSVIGIQAERTYGRVPYHNMLDGFPKSWIIPKLNVDGERMTLNICPEDTVMRRPKFKGDDVRVGARIIGSDTGSARNMILDEIIRMICTNGMIRATFETFFERFHRGSTAGLIIEWRAKVEAFVAYVPGRMKAEADRIESAMARTYATEEDASNILTRMGMSKTRATAAIAYAQTEFHALNAWSVSQGVTFISQTSARDAMLPASPATQEALDIIGAALFEGESTAA